MGEGGGTGSPRHREHGGLHIGELVLVTARGGAGGGAMTFLVQLVEEHCGLTCVTVACLRPNAPVHVGDEGSGSGGERVDDQDQGGGGGTGSLQSAALAFIVVFA